jgi:hypothetical protein
VTQIQINTNPEAVSGLNIQTVDVDGQLLRVGIWHGRDTSPPLVIFNGIGANLELVEPSRPPSGMWKSSCSTSPVSVARPHRLCHTVSRHFR